MFHGIFISISHCNHLPRECGEWHIAHWYKNKKYFPGIDPLQATWSNVKMPSCQRRNFHYKDKTIIWSSYWHIRESYSNKMVSIFIYSALEPWSVATASKWEIRIPICITKYNNCFPNNLARVTDSTYQVMYMLFSICHVLLTIKSW